MCLETETTNQKSLKEPKSEVTTSGKCSFCKISQTFPSLCPQITGVPQKSLVTVVKPGLPTAADLFVLPLDNKQDKKSVFVDKVHVFYFPTALTTEAN